MYFNESLLDVIVDSDNHIMLIMGHLVYLIINSMIFIFLLCIYLVLGSIWLDELGFETHTLDRSLPSTT